LITDPEEGLRCHSFGLEARYKFCNHCTLRVILLRLAPLSYLLLALLGQLLDEKTGRVALEVALDLDDLGHGAFYAQPFSFRLGLFCFSGLCWGRIFLFSHRRLNVSD